MIAPPPRVTALVNNKIAFTELVVRLFGENFVPRTYSAWNFAILAQRVKALADSSPAIGIKLPCSAGGDGTLVVDADEFARLSLGDVHRKLKEMLRRISWNGASELLIDSWETNILGSPSAQLWIPPQAEGSPVVEGLFEQVVEGRTGVFVGSSPAVLSAGETRELVNRCWLIARLFQQLGYVGRCSFDAILVGDSRENARLEFVECNGRWGGTSAPMTLMNRLFGDWRSQSYAYRVCEIKGLDQRAFEDLLACLGDSLFDCRTMRGQIILALPGRMAARSAIDVIALGDSSKKATEVMDKLFIQPLLGVTNDADPANMAHKD